MQAVWKYNKLKLIDSLWRLLSKTKHASPKTKHCITGALWFSWMYSLHSKCIFLEEGTGRGYKSRLPTSTPQSQHSVWSLPGAVALTMILHLLFQAIIVLATTLRKKEKSQVISFDIAFPFPPPFVYFPVLFIRFLSDCTMLISLVYDCWDCSMMVIWLYQELKIKYGLLF